MESHSNMFDTFKDEIWKELGPLDPDWFQVLSAQTSTDEGNVSDQDELCANQEGNFKTPCNKTALDSQLFSTPKVFRCSRAASPETEGEQSFTADHDKEAGPWKESQSPCLFQMTKERVPGTKGGLENFDFLQTSPKSPVSYAKQISESLGAQIHPDISWTSSLCTPPAVPSTLILSKTDESPCSISISADSNVVFVRKLFPSLSNNKSVVAAVSPKHDDVAAAIGVVSPEARQNPESRNSPEDSPSPSQRVWRQSLPDAIEDGDVRSTIASVLDGAENVLSIFFSNSSSALRKVKTDRIKRKQVIPTKEPDCSITDISTKNAASLEQSAGDCEPVNVSLPPPPKARDAGVTQWSPLSLSEIPSSTVDSSLRDNSQTTQVDDKTMLTRPHLTGPYYGFTKKRRQFVYTIESPKTQTQRNETPSLKNDASQRIPDSGSKLLGQIQDEADCFGIREDEIQKQKKVPEENVFLPVQPKAQDLDMSQLSRDFAQDFSQSFSPSTCLNAMKQAKLRAGRDNLHHGCDLTADRRPVSATAQHDSINEGTGADSGFQSVVAEISHVNSGFILPSSNNIDQSQQRADSKADTQRAASALSTNVKHVRYHSDDILEGAEMDVKLPGAVKESQTKLPSRAPEGNNISNSPASLPSLHASGFQTASNKAIEISSAHLERAGHLFEENKVIRTLSAESIKRGNDAKDEMSISVDSVKMSDSKQALPSIEIFGDIGCQLTASQKADVTELCTLLEEADSQFEFTQFKTAKPQQQHRHGNAASPQKVDKDLDPDFLLGIDFDDSFSPDAGKHKMPSVSDDKTKREASDLTHKSTTTKENSSTECTSPSSKSVSEGRRSVVSAEHQSPNRGHENKTPLMLGFKTARGNDLSISKEHMSKAKALFADLEGNQADQTSTEKHSREALSQTKQRRIMSISHKDAAETLNTSKLDSGSGFQLASGKGVPVSAKAMQEAHALFKDCDIGDDKAGVSVKHQESKEQLPTSASHTKNHLKCKDIRGRKENLSEEAFDECSKATARPGASHTKVVRDPVEIQSMTCKNTSSVENTISSHENLLTGKAFSSPSCSTSKSCGSSGKNQLSNGGGFSSASGKRVCVSADAVKQAERLLNEIHTQLKQEGDALRKDHVAGQIKVGPIQNGGFQTASGKGVAFSAAALKKAKSLFDQCEAAEDDIDGKQAHSKMPVCGLASRKGGFLAASGKPVRPSAEALHKAKALFSDISQGNAENPAEPHDHFMAAGAATVCLFQKKKFKTKHILKEENCSYSEQMEQDADKYDGGVAPVSGEKNQLSQDGRPTNTFDVNMRDVLHHDDGKIFKDLTNGIPSKQLSSRSCTSLEKAGSSAFSKFSEGGGFCTASGKKVCVSDDAMTKAMSLLNESAFLTDTKTTLKEENRTAQSGGKGVALSFSAREKDKAANTKSPVSCSPPRTSGFLAASGKPVAFSHEALLKAKTLFSDDFSAEIQTAPDSRKSERQKEAQNYAGKISCGFSTAGGAKVHVSQKNLLQAKNLFKECADEGVHSSVRKEAVNTLGCEVNRTKCSQGPKSKRPQDSFLIHPFSLNLSGCSESQQRFLAQEALDCTKALLEDESFSSGNEPLEDNLGSKAPAEEQKGRGKRLGDHAGLTGQPPLKRRLLEEFDQTDVSRGSTLQPQRTCPVTSGGSRSAHSKMPTFVPPFLKNPNTETCKNAVLKVNIRTPPAFVPPFKKQRTIVQERPRKPQQEEDKHQHCFVTPANSSTLLPPTKKTQTSADVAGNKSKQGIPQVALADTKQEYLTNNPFVPVGSGSDDSAAQSTREDDTIPRGQDVFQNFENVELARDMQDMRIRKKKRQTIRPLPGRLFLTKTSGVSRIPLKAAANGNFPARFTSEQLYGYGVHQHVADISSESAEDFHFNLRQLLTVEAFTDGGVQMADGGWLIPHRDGTAGKEEFYKALCDTPGVDPRLISKEWVYNHFRWIVWKQASMERSFPGTMGGLCLTPQQVLLQLKYRYDVEVDHSRRPALRKIMEKDDTSAKTLVLCVCGVVSRGHSSIGPGRSDAKTPQGADGKVEPPSAVIWLTDGWYAIKAQLDEPLTAMLHKGRLAVGGKLLVSGAQLVGSQDACSPLEAPESLMLKIGANSTRPARWDTKLGFHRDPRPFLLPVSSLFSSGGPVGCVDITVLRSYPIQWMERRRDGGVVFRSVRAEEKEARRHGSQKQKSMEILFAKIQTEFEKEQRGNSKPQRRRRTINRQEIADLQDGEELSEAVEADPAYLEAHLSDQQLERLQTYRRSLMEKKQAELQDRYRRALEGEGGTCPKRDVTPVWRLSISDSKDNASIYQLNLWRPSSDLQSLLKEGRRYKVYNLAASEGKKRSGIEAVQLTGTKKTQFQDLEAQEVLSANFQPRVSTSFLNLQNPEFQPLCGEVDLTGCVVSVIDGEGSSPAFYLADGELSFMKVRCFSSFAQSGLEDVVKPRVLLALSNLQLRGQALSPTPVVYAGDLTVFSTNPKEVHLQESLSQLRNLLQGQQNFFPTAEEKLSHLLKSDGLSSISSPALHPRTPAGVTDRREEPKTSLIAQQPIRSFGAFTPVSTSAPTSLTEKDPRSLKRRRALDYLCRIPSPPALLHLGSVASPCVKKTFRPPRRSETPSTLKTAQAPARKPLVSPKEDDWVKDEELAMIDTQKLYVSESM